MSGLRGIFTVEELTKMAIIAGKITIFILMSGAKILLAACGLTQKTFDGNVAVTKSYKSIKMLYLDVYARKVVNNKQCGRRSTVYGDKGLSA